MFCRWLTRIRYSEWHVTRARPNWRPGVRSGDKNKQQTYRSRKSRITPPIRHNLGPYPNAKLIQLNTSRFITCHFRNQLRFPLIAKNFQHRIHFTALSTKNVKFTRISTPEWNNEWEVPGAGLMYLNGTSKLNAMPKPYQKSNKSCENVDVAQMITKHPQMNDRDTQPNSFAIWQTTDTCLLDFAGIWPSRSAFDAWRYSWNAKINRWRCGWYADFFH